MEPCKKCPEDSYAPGNAKECLGCSRKTCPSGQFRAGQCGGELDNYRCEDCDNMVCNEGEEFRTGECAGVNNGACDLAIVPVPTVFGTAPRC